MALDPKNKRFVRVNTDVVIRFKLLSKEVNVGTEEILQGFSSNISKDGFYMVSKPLPGEAYGGLIDHRILLGANVVLPTDDEPIKALCEVSWIEHTGKDGKVGMGVMFREIPREGQDAIQRFTIRTQLS